MLETEKTSKNIGSRFEKKLDRILADHLNALDDFNDFTTLAFAYMHDSLEHLDEKMFGKLEVCPEAVDYSSRSTLRFMQAEIRTEVGEYVMVYGITSSVSSLLRLQSGDSDISDKNRLADNNLDTGLKRIISDKRRKIPEITPEIKRRWVYAVATLAMFDETQRKIDDMPGLRLEMRKMILDGYSDTSLRDNTFAQEIMNTTDRNQLIASLDKYCECV